VPRQPEPPPLPPKSYEAKGRRDPFRSLATTEGPATGLTVASVKLVGIVQGREGPLALVETSDGVGYILRVGDLIGDGKVLEIGTDSVRFSVTRRPGEAPTRVLVRMRAD
jgi:Tfp pilus assembly protein PilP